MCEPRRHFTRSCLTSAQFTEERHRNHTAPHNPHDILHGAAQALFLTNFVEIVNSRGSPGWNAWEQDPAMGRVGGLKPGAPHVDQGWVLGVGLPRATGRALPQGSRLLEESGPPSVVSQYLGWTGAGLQLPAEGMDQDLMCMFTAVFHSLAKPRGEVWVVRVGMLAALGLGGDSAGTHAWKAWPVPLLG